MKGKTPQREPPQEEPIDLTVPATLIGVLLGILGVGGSVLGGGALVMLIMATAFALNTHIGGILWWLLFGIIIGVVWGVAAIVTSIKGGGTPIAGALGIAESTAIIWLTTGALLLLFSGLLWVASGLVLADFALRAWRRSGGFRNISVLLALIPLILLVIPPAVCIPSIVAGQRQYAAREAQWREAEVLREQSEEASRQQIVSELLAKENWVQKFDANGALLGQWGSYGTVPGQFRRPSAITVDRAGNVYILDSGHSQVLKFSPEGTFILSYGSKGDGDGQFLAPRGIAVDGAGNVYVACCDFDGLNATAAGVQKFSPQGQFLGRWRLPQPHASAFAVTVDSSGNVYVADTMSVVAFDSEGRFLTQWETGGGIWNTGIAVDSAGNIYVSHSSHYVKKFSSSGTLLKEWYGPTLFTSAIAIAVDRLDNVYVVTSSEQLSIRKYTSDGKFLRGWGSTEGRYVQIRGVHSVALGPVAIAVDAVGNVWVIDRNPYPDF